MNAPLQYKLNAYEIDFSNFSDAELLSKLQDITQELSELLEVLRGVPRHAVVEHVPPPHEPTKSVPVWIER